MTCRPEKVLGFLLKGYPRISETFISNEILLLEDMGFPLHIISMRQPREAFSHKSVSQIKAPVDYLPETLIAPLARLMYHNVQLMGRRPAAYAKAYRLMVKRYRRSHKLASIKHLLQAGYLVHAVLPNSGVQHIHAHFAHSPTSVALFSSCLSGLPFSFTAHAKDIYTSAPEQLEEKIRLAQFVVTCTQYNKRYLERLAAGAGPIHCIYHGIDVRLFSAVSTQRRPEPPYRLLSVARLVEKKGLPTVFRALKLLRDRGTDFHYSLIGDGEQRQQILQELARLHLGRMSEWLGTLPHEEVLQHYQNSDLFVLGCEVARNGDRDGIPNVLLESMAMGLPVVATTVSAIPEALEDGRHGLLVPPGRPEAMAAAMKRLLLDQELRSSIIQAARDKVLRQFDNRHLIGQLGELFADAGLPRRPGKVMAG
ncbi:MAG: glycosyltransferase family 4 protein [Deltaproteobacteria bacterium]|nr:glycosyltransferase family 4 protein [Deltaproteobacteria bacterium]MBW2072042.1 glycosyltransferase family 4 protein [Deltaproteobacteria bacterium]